jgi:hypothetical protein
MGPAIFSGPGSSLFGRPEATSRLDFCRGLAIPGRPLLNAFYVSDQWSSRLIERQLPSLVDQPPRGRAVDPVTMISRRSVLTALAVLAVAPCRYSRAAATDPAFLVLGDWGHGVSADQRKVAVQMAKTAEAIGARFVISTGDNFYPAGAQSMEDAQWVTSFEDVYNASALMLPWYITLGNPRS